ncbi:MAG TPA: hypothetical protein VN554_00370 [Verrucomicrobiae bacterium]|nr:hypothetical protein [Verrucomicrobiae bacterium]
MSEITGPPPSGGPDEQIRWMAETCHFLVVRPDMPWDEREPALALDPDADAVTAAFGLDGEYVTVTVPYEEEPVGEHALVGLAGEPQRNEVGDWFALQQLYTLSAPAGSTQKPTIEMEQQYLRELFGQILPEHYEAIRGEYELQSRDRNRLPDGWDAGDAGLVSFQGLKDSMLSLSSAVGMQMVCDGKLRDLGEVGLIFDRVEELILEGMGPNGISDEEFEAAFNVVHRAAMELKEEMENRHQAAALGLDRVSPTERAGLIFKLNVLREDPDTHEILSFPEFGQA